MNVRLDAGGVMPLTITLAAQSTATDRSRPRRAIRYGCPDDHSLHQSSHTRIDGRIPIPAASLVGSCRVATPSQLQSSDLNALQLTALVHNRLEHHGALRSLSARVSSSLVGGPVKSRVHNICHQPFVKTLLWPTPPRKRSSEKANSLTTRDGPGCPANENFAGL